MIQKYLKKFKTGFDGLKLNVKFMLLIICFIEVTVGIFSGLLFYNMEKNAIQEKLNGIRYELDREYGQIRKNVETINMSTQLFLSNQALREYLTDIRLGNVLSAERVNEFYHKDVAAMEQMVNSNLALYQVRVYVEGDNMLEMMPVLYTSDRMKRLEWAGDEPLYGWKLNYTDAIFDTYTISEKNRIVSLVTPIEDYEHGTLAVLEVAMTMETMFGGLYAETEDMGGCFLEESGKIYYGAGQEDNAALQSVLSRVNTGEETFFYDIIDGREVVAGSIKIKELPGTLVCVQDISAAVAVIKRTRRWFFLGMVLLIPLLAAGVNIVIKTMLQQFYRIIDAIKRVQTGDLDVVIEDCGTDEMGELGNQINKMLLEIRQLMEDNLNRELLVKNSEIKALQNQINAHFIYNVLESIKMMAEIDEKYEISDAITALGKLLRYSMHWDSKTVTVAQEIDYIKNYLKLINIRFDYEIYLSLNVPETIYRQQIPKMSLQPIVENAIYHGIEQMAEDTNIYIKGLLEGKDCIIEITDAGRGMSEEEVEKLRKKIAGEIETTGGSGNGIGLKNVQDRLQMSFGEEYGIEIASKLGCYTKIKVHIPLSEHIG